MSDIKLTSSLLQQKADLARAKGLDASARSSKVDAPSSSDETLKSSPIRDSVSITPSALLEKVSGFQGLLENVENAGRTLDTALSALDTITAKFEEIGGIAIQTGRALAEGRSDDVAAFQSRFEAAVRDIDNLAKNAGFPGENLLAGDVISFKFGDEPGAQLHVEGFKSSATDMGIGNVVLADEGVADGLKLQMRQVLDELGAFRSQLMGDSFEVETRKEFAQSSIDLFIGAVQASAAQVAQQVPANDEAAALLALQTRQMLEESGGSLASDAQRSLLEQF
ncbi:MAG: hypothetical protein AB7E85_01565 [Pseudobdellovibrionaceae bacterium]